jgi:hypothetical protein
MEKVKAGDKDLLVRDLYEIRALIQGFVSDGKIIYSGFINEKSLTEGTKRIANKIAKQINSELEAIDKQRVEIMSYTEEGKTEVELKAIRANKENELLSDAIDFSVEKLDFKRIENLTLSGNYQFLYDTIFKE